MGMGEGFEGWLTVAAAAQRFGVKRDRLQRAAMEGRLRARKLGEGRSHPWLVRPEEVERFLRESRRGPKPRRREAPHETSPTGVMTG
jgi:excisionase family DNA binding protein